MESAESRIKEMIFNNYGSLKKFCEIINMPWTTLDSILKRGFANSNITNVMKISHELRVDTESLAAGKVVESDEILSAKVPFPKIMQYYETLNDFGKHEATKRVEELTHFDKYTTPKHLLLNAAHERTDIEVTKEMLQHDEDIMDDDDF